MKNANQANLFYEEQPNAIECAGMELLPLVDELKARGAIPFAMSAICPGRWRLHLHWTEKPATRLNRGRAGK